MFDFIIKYNLIIMVALQSVCGLIIILTLFTDNLGKSRKIAIVLLELTSILYLASSQFYNMYKNNPGHSALLILKCAKFFDHLFGLIVIFSFGIYLKDLFLHEGGFKKLPALLFVSDFILLAGVIILIISQFTNFYYSFDQNNVYIHGKGRLISYILPFAALVFQFICILRFFNRFTNRIRIPILLFIFIPLVASILQFFHGGISASNISTVGMSIVIYVFAIQEMNKTIENAHKREVQILENYQKELENTVELRTKELKAANEKARNLLLNILPEEVAKELSENPDKIISQKYPNATVLFTDIVGFTKLSSTMTAEETVSMLNNLTSLFDERSERDGVEKIKTIGDAYMAVTGLNKNQKNDGVMRMIKFALGLLKDVDDFNQKYNQNLQIRIGINSGNLVAGVIGKKKFIYDVWGDTVNVASRMESSGKPMQIHLSSSVYLQAKDKLPPLEPVKVDIKGKGIMDTYFLRYKKN